MVLLIIKTIEMKKWEISVALITILLGTVLGYAWEEYHRKPADTKYLPEQEKIEAMTLVKEFTTDETTANRLYNDKVVSVKGTVLKIENNGDVRDIVLGNETSPQGVICEFQAKHKKEADKIRPGQQITVKGVCTGMLLDVVLVRCVLE
jgi:hypothetical protein